MGLIAGRDPVDQLPHCGDKAVGIERVLGKAIRAVPGEHQIVVQIAAMGDVHEGFLDAEAARVSFFAGAIIPMVSPIGEFALAEAAHAIGLILVDFPALFRIDKDQCLAAAVRL